MPSPGEGFRRGSVIYDLLAINLFINNYIYLLSNLFVIYGSRKGFYWIYVIYDLFVVQVMLFIGFMCCFVRMHTQNHTFKKKLLFLWVLPHLIWAITCNLFMD